MFYLKIKSMKKLVSLFLCMVLLLSMVVWAEPVKTCQEAGEFIADTEDGEVYYQCDVEMNPIMLWCSLGLVFDASLKICRALQEIDNPVCKTPKGMPYGCYAGYWISFRPSCKNKSCIR